jgi:DNA-directed RNA polymerase subunit RPC12/RpoP
MALARTGGGASLDDHRFPCPACGADLRFSPETGGLRCDHCGHEEAIPEQRGIPELDLRQAERSELPSSELAEIRVARCGSCGAQVEFDAAIHAKECPFCASPMVTDTGLSRTIKPQAQLPFLMSEEQAHAAMRTWLGRRWFAPSNLNERARSERRMDGIYVPYWTYDAESRTRYSGQRGTVYYETRQVSVVVKGRRQMQAQQVAKVRWSPARGNVARDFDDVLVLGSTSLPKRFTDALAPWDLSALSAFDPRYLAGFRAEGYGVPVEDGYREAREEMNEVITGDVRRDIGGDQQRIEKMETDVGRLTFKHVLLPVWIAAYRYGGRSYRFVVNGRTGSVAGERPYSKAKIAFAILLAILAATAIAYLNISEM